MNFSVLVVLENAAKQNGREKFLQDVLPSLNIYKTSIRNDPGFIAFIKSDSMRLITFLLSLNW